MTTLPVTFRNARGQAISARLELPPDRKPRAFALFAHCFTCGKDFTPTRNIARALTQVGYGVLRFDFTGLGMSEGEFAATNFSHNVADLYAACGYLTQHYREPQLLVGHSLGGTAVLAAALEMPNVQAVATIGSPAEPVHVEHLIGSAIAEIESAGKATVNLGGRPFTIEKQFLDDLRTHPLPESIRQLGERGTGLLVLHAPQDQTVGIENARTLYEAAIHPKSFVSLDEADHLLLRPDDSAYAGNLIAHWSLRYVTLAPETELTTHRQVVAQTPGQTLTTELLAGSHYLMADEPAAVGDDDLGPTPYELLQAALGACTSMTLQLYAARKGWDLRSVAVHLAYGKLHAEASQAVETEPPPKMDLIVRELVLEGQLTEEQRARLLEIANRCPVHRTLERGVTVETHLQPAG